MRIAAIAMLLVTIVGAVAWVGRVMADNERLQADVQTATDANSSLTDAMHAMAREQVRLNQQIIERDHTQRSIQRDLATTQRRLHDARRDATITGVQRECLDSDIPGPVLDILRHPPGGDGDGATGSGVPRGPTLLGDSAAAIQRFDLGGPGGVRCGAAGGCALAARGSSGGEGVLW